MEATYIVPFIKSVQNVFGTMLQTQVEVGNPELKKAGSPAYDISGIIGMSGDVEGSVVLSFPTAVAERVVSLFTGTDMDHAHDDFADAVGELVNMISGGAKAQFKGKSVSISCPSVVIGNDHVVFNRKDVVSIHIPCTSEVGDFAVEVSVRQTTAPAGAGQSAAAAVKA
ncbi:MAG: chemotaxis protein CheX [Phycisphaera sp.]|nr:chemotaxis protein CheX [Phycisphaera sp.]